jgi:mono/diheme cytochrome c family protein
MHAVKWMLLLGVLAGCGGESPRPPAALPASPSAPDAPAGLVRESQRAGDPARGYAALVGEGYVGCGVPRSLWDRFNMQVPAGWRLERPRGAELPYFMNAVTMPSGVEVVTANCLGCHAASLRGQLVIGLGEASMDFTADPTMGLAVAAMTLTNDAERAELGKLSSRLRAVAPYTRMRTVGANPADQIAAVLFAHRDPTTLAWSDTPLIPLPAADEQPIPVDVPAWWLLKKKAVMFHTAAGRGDHARIMMTASVLCVDDVDTATTIDAYFPDIRAYVLSLTAPAYPEPIDATLAARGRATFERTCSKCHGTYGEGGSYPSKLVSLATVKTDPALASHAAQFAAPFTSWFNRSFFGKLSRLEPGTGYIAPPLDGVWATAPYFHNGSVPNLAAVLDSSQRHARTRIVRGSRAYDLAVVGGANEPAAADETGKYVYDTAHAGYGNGGHTFGDRLSPAERAALLEYLKTL